MCACSQIADSTLTRVAFVVLPPLLPAFLVFVFTSIPAPAFTFALGVRYVG